MGALCPTFHVKTSMRTSAEGEGRGDAYTDSVPDGRDERSLSVELMMVGVAWPRAPPRVRLGCGSAVGNTFILHGPFTTVRTNMRTKVVELVVVFLLYEVSFSPDYQSFG